MSSEKRNYRVVYDPELDPNSIKRSTNPTLEYENNQGIAKDPRPSKDNYEMKSRLYKPHLMVVEFDKTNSKNIPAKEDNSKKTVLLSNILPLSTESQIITVLSVYGTVQRIEIIKDRSTGGPLGYVKATFMEESAALSAVKNGNGRRVIISDSMKIEFDFTGEKLKAALSPAEKNHEIKQDDSNEYRPTAQRSSTGNANDDIRFRKKTPSWSRPITGDNNIQRSLNNHQDYRSNHVNNERASSDQRPYVKATISRQHLPFLHGALEELERLFRPFGYNDIHHDSYDWLIMFDTKQAAIQAQKYVHDNNPRVFGYPIELSLPSNNSSSTRPNETPEASSVKRPPQQPPPPEPTALSETSVNSLTKRMFCDELANIFVKDVKNRVTGPFIYDYLSSSVPKKTDTFKSPETTHLSDTAIGPAAALESNIQNNSESIYKLPRFKKSTSSSKPPSSQPLDLIKSVVQESIPVKKPNQKDITTFITPEKKVSMDVDTDRKLYRRLSKESSDSSSEDDFLGSTKASTVPSVSTTKPANTMNKKKKPKKKQIQFDSDSAEDTTDSEEDIEEAYRRITSKRRRSSKASASKTTTTTKRRKSSSSSQHSLTKKPPVHVNMVIDETNNTSKHSTSHVSTPITIDSPSTMDIDIDGDDDEHITTIDHAEQAPKEPEYDQAAIDKLLEDIDQEDDEEVLWSDQDEVVELNKEWDPYQQTKDVEDLEYLRIALMEKTELPDPNTINTALEKLERNDKRLSQSARTRGYYPIPDAIKATYLNKNKATYDPPVHPTSTSESSRSNRVNNRRLFVGMVMQNKAMADADIVKFNQLKNRKKQLQFQKSPIHDWGLFSKERIDANDMVIEYIGEVVRQQVALEREREYERAGIGSSYLFRVDEDTVIDATKKGSIARFINHCCVPNCSAKIITVDKQKKIVIYANRDIEPGEEITYDYKFPIEADKIPCLCGSKFCKGTLN